jgi:hypothetical protein
MRTKQSLSERTRPWLRAALPIAVLALLPAAGIAQDVTIFNDSFESGDLTVWSGASTDGGDLSVSGAAALHGFFGLRAAVNDRAGLFVFDDTPEDESRYGVGFRFDPNGFDPGEAQSHFRTRIFIAFEEAPTRRLMAVVLRRIGGQYSLMARARLDDDSQANTSFVDITDAPHTVEVRWQRSDGPDAANGRLRMLIDGVEAALLTGLDNSLSAVDLARMGALSVKAGANGVLYWDDFRSFRFPSEYDPGTGGGESQLVINEVDYDNPSADTNEFVEIYNPGPDPASLAGVKLVLVNGAGDTVYGTIDLDSGGTLAAGQYLVVASNTVTVPPSALVIRFAGPDNNLQNGGLDPDGLLLTFGAACEVADALSYEGSITDVDVGACGRRNLVEGTATTVADDGTFTDSLQRSPNGADTDNAAADWVRAAPTPGAPNN